jgi:hypothetical protein
MHLIQKLSCGVGLLQVANIIRLCHKFTTSVSTSNLTCFGIGSLHAVAIGVYGFGSYAMTGIAQGMAQGMQNTGERVSSQTITSEGRQE